LEEGRSKLCGREEKNAPASVFVKPKSRGVIPDANALSPTKLEKGSDISRNNRLSMMKPRRSRDLNMVKQSREEKSV
jgi:hypothetical protein